MRPSPWPEEGAVEYAADVSGGTSHTEYIGLAQSYWLAEEPGHGAEVFDLIRDRQVVTT